MIHSFLTDVERREGCPKNPMTGIKEKGRCENCEGEGFVMVELLFLPSVYAPCPVCHGARYNEKTLEIRYREKNIADVLGLTPCATRNF